MNTEASKTPWLKILLAVATFVFATWLFANWSDFKSGFAEGSRKQDNRQP